MITEWPENKNEHYIFIKDIKVFIDHTNKRLKILEHTSISDNTITYLIDFARSENLTKIISNCTMTYLKFFQNCGFKEEGIIKGFFKGEDAYCISFFVDKKREISYYKEEEDDIINQSVAVNKKISFTKTDKYIIRSAVESDISQMINLFKNVFETYPSPVFSRNYLKKVMNEDILFKVAVEDDKIISVSSADMDRDNLNAEITDCATYPEHRGRGIVPNLIHCLEQELIEKKFLTLYSLSRAINPGINITFSKLGYNYGGRLVNNCHICGRFEDMNIWVKKLSHSL